MRPDANGTEIVLMPTQSCCWPPATKPAPSRSTPGMSHPDLSPHADRLARELERVDHLAPSLRRALVLACRSRPPVLTVEGLAARAIAAP